MKRLIMAALLALSAVSCNVSTVEQDTVNSDVLAQIQEGEPDTLVVYHTVDKRARVESLAMFDLKGNYKGTVATEMNTVVLLVFLGTMIVFGMGLGVTFKK